VAAGALSGCGGIVTRNGDGAGSSGAPGAGPGNAPSSGAAPSAGTTFIGDPVTGQAGSAAVPLGPCERPGDGVPRALGQSLSGNYSVAACGSARACAKAGENVSESPLPSFVNFIVEQELGHVTIYGTGEPLLDNRPFDATFGQSSFAVELHGPLSATCAQNYSISFRYDFDDSRPGARLLALDFERSPKCSGNAGEYCQGSVRSDFGAASKIPPKAR
jgi:hypothetical protein